MQLVSRFYQISAEGFQLALTALHDIAGQGAGDVFILLAHDAVVDFFGKGWREGDTQCLADGVGLVQEGAELLFALGLGKDVADRPFVIGRNDIVGAVRNVFVPDFRRNIIGEAARQAFAVEHVVGALCRFLIVGTDEQTGEGSRLAYRKSAS